MTRLPIRPRRGSPGSQQGDDGQDPRGQDAGDEDGVAGPVGGQRQESVRVAVPPEGVVKERSGSLSQVTEPSGFFLMYLYRTVVPGGRFTVALQTG